MFGVGSLKYSNYYTTIIIIYINHHIDNNREKIQIFLIFFTVNQEYKPFQHNVLFAIMLADSPPPYGWMSRVWDSLLVMKPGEGGRGFAPQPGAILRRVFRPARKLVRLSLLKCPSIPYSKSSPLGSVTYRPSASPSYEASSHDKNYAYSGKLLQLNNPYPWYVHSHILLCCWSTWTYTSTYILLI